MEAVKRFKSLYLLNSVYKTVLRAARKKLYFVGSQQMLTLRNMNTAGIIVIGDEILKGQTKDSNSGYLCKQLFNLGIKVHKVSVVGDNLDEIACEVKAFSERYKYVLTSGGIGPTHDDMTFDGVARAFGEKVALNSVLRDLVWKYFGDVALDSPNMKLAQVPESAQLNFGTAKYPIVSVRNVFVLPGVPVLLERGFNIIKSLFTSSSTHRFHTKEVFVNLDEFAIADILTQFQCKYQNELILGSYPKFFNSYYKVKLTLQGSDDQLVSKAADELRQLLPQGSILEYITNPVESVLSDMENVHQRNATLATLISQANDVIAQCYNTYSPEQVCISFNGGKDATVLLHLVHAFLQKQRKPDQNENHLIKALYIRQRFPFQEKEEFIWKCKTNYKLSLIVVTEDSYKRALQQLHAERPEIKAILMGTRNTDPRADGQSALCMTDSGWPQYMRVNPLLHFTYGDIWRFVRHFCLPYCSLYDHGYTSLGSSDQTHPNESLQFVNSEGQVCYKPAYDLEDEGSERTGRVGTGSSATPSQL